MNQETTNISNYHLGSSINDQVFDEVYDQLDDLRNRSIQTEQSFMVFERRFIDGFVPDTLQFWTPLQFKVDEYINISPKLVYHYDFKGINDPIFLSIMIYFMNLQTGCWYQGKATCQESVLKTQISLDCNYQHSQFYDNSYNYYDKCLARIQYIREDKSDNNSPFKLNLFDSFHNHQFNQNTYGINNMGVYNKGGQNFLSLISPWNINTKIDKIPQVSQKSNNYFQKILRIQKHKQEIFNQLNEDSSRISQQQDSFSDKHQQFLN